MEAAIRFSQNSLPGQPEQYFLKIDVAGRILQLYNIKSKHGRNLQYELVHASSKLPPFRAFDWHPTEAHLVAIGQTGGESCLVNLAEPQETPLTFNVRSPRACNAVGLSTQNWLAIGLEKVKNDFCLNVWDLNQRTSGSYAKSSSRGNEALHKLAGGESISSLRFFQDTPQLLAAGVKGQFIRLYDLRTPTATFALQFSTRCVNNIAIDNRDENYFASCLPSSTPMVTIWDRRMSSRSSTAHVGFGSYITQAEQLPEASLEFKNVVDSQGQIWGLRFSKSKRGQLGVLSSTGQVRILQFGTEGIPQSSITDMPTSSGSPWHTQTPQSIFLDDSHNFSNAWYEFPQVSETQRIVSFDFTTGLSKNGQAKIIAMTGDGAIDVRSIRNLNAAHPVSLSRAAINYSVVETVEDVSIATSSVPDSHPLDDISIARLRGRCANGYLLDADINVGVIEHDEKLTTLWSWLRHARNISDNGALIEGDVDYAFVGVFAIWMEEIDVRSRAQTSTVLARISSLSTGIRTLARRLNLHRGKGCATEYPDNRALCLLVSGTSWLSSDIEVQCERLIANKEYTKAAALALFGGEVKLAHKCLRAEGTDNSHKMLAMALLGARDRQRRTRSTSMNSEKSQNVHSDDEVDPSDDWTDLVTVVSQELSDCYAKSILAYVKSGSWDDVANQDCLPLPYRINVALRHLDDSKLTKYLSRLKQDVMANGDLAGILVTGVGTSEGVKLLQRYAANSRDVQTSALAMSFEAATDRFLPEASIFKRTVFCFRAAYKAQLMTADLKFEKARFDVAMNRTLRHHKVNTGLRKKEQIKLICTYCNESISHFGHDQQATEQSATFTETQRHPLQPEKAAVAGVICPKCGRHLPRCGVCDLWVGTYDETYSKWYKPPTSQRNSNSMDLPASMAGSQVTTIGPAATAPLISITSANGTATKPKTKPPTTAELPPNPLEETETTLEEQERDRVWYQAMHKFTVFCTRCSHGFHAEHARMWFDGTDGIAGHSTCPVPLCECLCKG